MVEREFWPSDLFGGSIECDLKKMGKTASGVMIFVYITAVFYFTGLFVIPLSSGYYNLPQNTYYGFNFGLSPFFEILYIMQCWTNMYVIMHGIRGHDDLFVALSTNCVGQFKLLKKAVSYLGTGNEKEINSLLNTQKLHQKDYCKYQKEEIKLLVRCVEHHRKLLKFCDYMEEAFSGSLCVQLFVSVAAICVSSFALIVVCILLLKATDPFIFTQVDLKLTEMPGLFSYCFGHITQLLIFCVLGNEIAFAVRDFIIIVFLIL